MPADNGMGMQIKTVCHGDYALLNGVFLVTVYHNQRYFSNKTMVKKAKMW